MRKIKLYIAMSLNGKIASKDGGVDWLEATPNPDKLDYGYQAFYDSVDTTIQGKATYQQIIDWGVEFPYKNTKNFVLTRNPNLANTEQVEFVSVNHISFIKQLKRYEGKDIWLIGGGQVNTLLLNAGLIDEIRVFVMPIIIPDGIGLFEALPPQTKLQLLDTTTFPTGVVELKYGPLPLNE